MDWLWIFSQNSHSMRWCHLIFFCGKGCTACIGTCCVSVGEWLSWRYQAQKGTKEQVKIPNTATLLLIWSAEHHQRTTALMQNTVCRYIFVFDMYMFCYLFPLEAWVAAMIRMCRQFFWKVTGKKRYQNDTRTIPQNAIWEPWAGGRPPTHPPEQNIDTLSLRATYSHCIFHGWKRIEKKKRRTKQSNKYSTLPWQCASQNADMMDWSDPVSHIIGSFVGLDTVPVICCAALLKQYKLYFYWKGPSAHSHTYKQTKSFFLTVFAGERAFQ